jgi:hypothetical protein
MEAALESSFVSRSFRVALVLTLAAMHVGLAALISFDADVTAIQKVEAPVPLLEARAGQKIGHVSASTCSEPQARSMVARRLQYAPVIVDVPSEHAATRETGRSECRPTQLMEKRLPTYGHG